ncbi:bifunctional helix-turn-helix transcriptional regulator/GNAT family N-acetyltransferase [Adhaeribacter aquaticus]|uniref:bifunctional helix-turn-helix transcriptional regulator/GNAT family N-acetyltransferase n=1 Tax=Adhaeribacter aquaticus TaxID=299567 RepID=UPI00047D4ACE|nr:helix-turn-helix domain-containing GNAT family N-acetyltransferase [Adhaeribacter aquaticus]
MDFYERTGKMALGSRLRKLSEMLTEDANKIYALYEVNLEPRWFPVFYMLAEQKEMGVMEISQAIKQSHASVSQVIKEMKKQGLVKEIKDLADGRRTLLSLTPEGEALVPKLKKQTDAVGEAAEELLNEMQYDLWKGIEEIEYLLERQSLYKRVAVKKKQTDCMEIEIVDYAPDFQKDFKKLNVEWIEKYFRLEEKDLLSLNNPQAYILDKGGHIIMAKYKGEIVGVVALLKMEENTYELAKMAVSPKVQGKGIGELLMKASIDKANLLQADKLFLETNTMLKPAINLYHKFGFYKITGKPSPYERANLQMELRLN